MLLDNYRKLWSHEDIWNSVKYLNTTNGRQNTFLERRKDQNLQSCCLQSCSAEVSVSPNRYYLISHVKAFRIPERHLIHVSPFEILTFEVRQLDSQSNSSSVVCTERRYNALKNFISRNRATNSKMSSFFFDVRYILVYR